ncbi:FMRFamide receptor [Aplysia californica]|uniref:FMRFamide receptor n=1 Tax=Aplysia californica TaxID=6500 RepID=A0ABM0JC93_APLCA|nr:FMRFamide receptor [Aplysia californica]
MNSTGSSGPHPLEGEPGYDLMMTGEVINKYYMWVIFAFGFPANVATIVTICHMRHLGSFVMYVALLAVMDNLAIVIKIVFYQLLLNKVNIATAGCRALEFLGNFLITYCNWLLVLMAIERLMAVRYPFRIHFQSCLTRQKAGVISAIVGGVIAGMYLPILWASTYRKNGQSVECQKDDLDLLQAIHWTSMAMYAFIPFIILVICNALIAREIRMSFRLRSAFRSINTFISTRHCDIPVQRQIMLMLFSTTFMFLLLHFPICVFVVATYWPVSGPQAYAIKYFCQQLAYLLCDSNHALNFYIYFLSARKFRKHFKYVITCMFCDRSVAAHL